MEYKPNAKALIQDLLIQDLMWNFFRHNWEGLKRFRGNTPAELGAYVRTCLVRLLTKYSKTMWSKMESLDASTVPDDEDAPKRGEILPASIPGPEAQYLKKEHKEAWKIMKKKLQSLISSLPPMEKAVFTRRFYKNMSSREVAQELYPAIEQKIGVNRVDVTYSHVKQNIGNILRNDEKLYALARATLNEGDVM
jgi:DNA-directed RNA polymerase specialized sigma24 family protein